MRRNKLFLLSSREAALLPEHLKKASYQGMESSWWTRTPSIHKANVCCMRSDGTINEDGESMLYGELGIRPALFILDESSLSVARNEDGSIRIGEYKGESLLWDAIGNGVYLCRSILCKRIFQSTMGLIYYHTSTVYHILRELEEQIFDTSLISVFENWDEIYYNKRMKSLTGESILWEHSIIKESGSEIFDICYQNGKRFLLAVRDGYEELCVSYHGETEVLSNVYQYVNDRQKLEETLRW